MERDWKRMVMSNLTGLVDGISSMDLRWGIWVVLEIFWLVLEVRRFFQSDMIGI